MRPLTLVVTVVGALLISVGVWYATGGKFAFFFLPLVFGLPLLRRGR